MAYSPEKPPESNYFLQYGWLMPRVYSDRRHYYFGYPPSLSFGIRPFVDLYAKARSGAVTPIYVKCTTPLNNVRITSFFAGESEVNIIDPRKVEILTGRLGKSIYGTLDGNGH